MRAVSSGPIVGLLSSTAHSIGSVTRAVLIATPSGASGLKVVPNHECPPGVSKSQRMPFLEARVTMD